MEDYKGPYRSEIFNLAYFAMRLVTKYSQVMAQARKVGNMRHHCRTINGLSLPNHLNILKIHEVPNWYIIKILISFNIPNLRDLDDPQQTCLKISPSLELPLQFGRVKRRISLVSPWTDSHELVVTPCHLRKVTGYQQHCHID